MSITKLEMQQLNLDTRLHQHNSAIQMELWQEAYKVIEDIHGLMTPSIPLPSAHPEFDHFIETDKSPLEFCF